MRAKPDKRRKSPKVITTDRDVELFEALWRHGVMTRSQVQVYFGWDCVSDINRRLRKLFDAGYVDRRFQARKFGPTSAVYLLGNDGVKVLAAEKGINATVLNRRRYRFKNISDHLLPHELLISDFACLLRIALARYPGCGLHGWKYDEQIVELCNVIEDGADLELKPDAYGSYHLNKMLYNFFLEADLGTEPLSRIKRKVELYRSFKASGLFHKNFNWKAFRLFIVTNSSGRVRNISLAMPIVDDLKVFTGNIEAMRIDPLFAPVWMMSGGSKAVPLHSAADLGAGDGQS